MWPTTRTPACWVSTPPSSREQEGAALDTIREVVCRLADEGPTQEELDRVREQARANLLMGAESVQSRMSQLGAGALLYGRVREEDEILALYDAVTREQLRELAGTLFQMEEASLSAVGRVGDGPGLRPLAGAVA